MKASKKTLKSRSKTAKKSSRTTKTAVFSKSSFKKKLKNADAATTAKLLGKGRANKFTVSIGREICERLAKGELLSKIVKEERMPCMLTVFNWKREHSDFATEFDAAREAQGEVRADEIMPIADSKKFHHADKAVRIGVRKWLAEVRKPSVYGKKVEVEAGDKLSNVMGSFASAIATVNNTGNDDVG